MTIFARRTSFVTLLLLLMVSMVPSVEALDFYAELEKGPLISVKRHANGSFNYAEAMVVIAAPAELVWDTILDIDSYQNYMSRIVEARTLSGGPDKEELIARFEIDTPMSNTKYTLRHVINKKERSIKVYQISGDLKGSSWYWKLVPRGRKTFVKYGGRTVNYSSFLQKFEDKEDTITVGINISSLMTTIKFIKDRAEQQCRR